jgi:hypothetical protein
MSQSKNTPANDQEQPVLFQKLGDQWFIFSEIANEVYYSQMPDGIDPRTTSLELYEVIEDHFKQIKANAPSNTISLR